MKRKIVKHGSSTLTVSLPNKWAKIHGIESGDEVAQANLRATIYGESKRQTTGAPFEISDTFAVWMLTLLVILLLLALVFVLSKRHEDQPRKKTRYSNY